MPIENLPVYPLTPEIIERARVPIDPEALAGVNMPENIWRLAVALMEECEVHLRNAAAVVRAPDGSIVPYNRECAVLIGLLVRLHKIVRSVLLLLREGEPYVANVLDRMIGETALSFLYLHRKQSRDELKRYLRGGLGNLKAAREIVRSGPGANEAVAGEVERLVDEVIEAAGFTLDEIDCKQDDRWRVNVWQRLEAVYDRDRVGIPPDKLRRVEYLTSFAGPAGSVHGDWVDLYLNHLKREGEDYLPDLDGGGPAADTMIRFVLFSSACVRDFVKHVLSQADDSGWRLAAVQDFVERINAVDQSLKAVTSDTEGGMAADGRK